ATDADWFSVQAPKGQKVTITVDGAAAGNVDLVATKGASSLLSSGTDDVSVAGDGSTVDVGVLPKSVNAGAYTIHVACEANAVDVASKNAAGLRRGCASGGMPASWGALLVGLALVRRRRR
ncbi:MAG TPA: PPC domain-containing protein, partial [Myxococcota bacterium]